MADHGVNTGSRSSEGNPNIPTPTAPGMRLYLCGLPLPLVWKEDWGDDSSNVGSSNKTCSTKIDEALATTGTVFAKTAKGLTAARKHVLGALVSIVGLILVALVIQPESRYAFGYEGFGYGSYLGGVHTVTRVESFWRQALQINGDPGTRLTVLEDYPEISGNQDLPTTPLAVRMWYSDDQTLKNFIIGPGGKVNVTWQDDARYKAGQIQLRVNPVYGEGDHGVPDPADFIDPIAAAREGISSYEYTMPVQNKTEQTHQRVQVSLRKPYGYGGARPSGGSYYVNVDATVVQYERSKIIDDTVIKNTWAPATVNLLYMKKQYVLVDTNAAGSDRYADGRFITRRSVQIARIVLLVVLYTLFSVCLAWAVFSPSARRRFMIGWKEAGSEENQPLLASPPPLHGLPSTFFQYQVSPHHWWSRQSGKEVRGGCATAELGVGVLQQNPKSPAVATPKRPTSTLNTRRPQSAQSVGVQLIGFLLRNPISHVNANAVKESQQATKRVDKTLHVKLMEAKNLFQEKSRHKDSYCTVTVEGGEKRWTPTVYHDSNPFFGEEIVFSDQLPVDVWRVTVEMWQDQKQQSHGGSHNALGPEASDRLLGRVLFPRELLEDGRFEEEQWFALSTVDQDVATLGEIKFGMRFTPTGAKAGKLTVQVHEVRNISAGSGTRDMLAVLHVIPDEGATSTRATTCVRDSLNPVFDQEVAIQIQDISRDLHLHVSLWDARSAASEGFMGHVSMSLESVIGADGGSLTARWMGLLPAPGMGRLLGNGNDWGEADNGCESWTDFFHKINLQKEKAYWALQQCGLMTGRQDVDMVTVKAKALVKSLQSPVKGNMRKKKMHRLIDTKFTNTTAFCAHCYLALTLGRTHMQCSQCRVSCHVSCSKFMANNCGDVGAIRLKIKYSVSTILSYDKYEPFVELLAIDNFRIAHLFGKVSKEREEAAWPMLVLTEARECRQEFLIAISSAEIQDTTDPNTLFRGNSMASKAIDVYMRYLGKAYLKNTLGEIIKMIVSKKIQLEVDPLKLDKPEEIEKNKKILLDLNQRILNAIYDTRFAIPAQWRAIFSHIKTQVTQKFPDNPTVQYTAVTGFIFLRFFAPSILGPRLFDLVDEYIEPKTSRTLTLLAKNLQALANLISFGDKEPYMKDMNQFLETNKEKMKLYVDGIAAKELVTPKAPSMHHVRYETAREAARLVQLFVRAAPSMMQNMNAKDAPLMRKLTTTLTRVLIETSAIEGKTFNPTSARGLRKSYASLLSIQPPLVHRESKIESFELDLEKVYATSTEALETLSRSLTQSGSHLQLSSPAALNTASNDALNDAATDALSDTVSVDTLVVAIPESAVSAKSPESPQPDSPATGAPAASGSGAGQPPLRLQALKVLRLEGLTPGKMVKTTPISEVKLTSPVPGMSPTTPNLHTRASTAETAASLSTLASAVDSGTSPQSRDAATATTSINPPQDRATTITQIYPPHDVATSTTSINPPQDAATSTTSINPLEKSMTPAATSALATLTFAHDRAHSESASPPPISPLSPASFASRTQSVGRKPPRVSSPGGLPGGKMDAAAVMAMLANARASVVAQVEQTLTTHGPCVACQKNVIGEQVIRVGGQVWHPDHFVCKDCSRTLKADEAKITDGQVFCAQHEPLPCSNCGEYVTEPATRLSIGDRTYHRNCFLCHACGCTLEKGFCTYMDAIVCIDDFLRFTGAMCGVCGGSIPGDYIDIAGRKYHVDCKRCDKCGEQLANKSYFTLEDNAYCSSHMQEMVTCRGCKQIITSLGSGGQILRLDGGKCFHPQCFRHFDICGRGFMDTVCVWRNLGLSAEEGNNEPGRGALLSRVESAKVTRAAHFVRANDKINSLP
ncbi:uncharacterized protein EV422DRAFT_577310 [Fimicolochytrium jonesii]|uniref:uncharacterized protein n=1 Tax=Fimicolochytrium jonesii TaxID=1396493 RepID=UPI0022FE8694|nr:uncharacterized protein EV422DRAFT_577310 [Fimicolochytrium jonesii]KAI8822960.1 hypothetical protein EV422DRAFT_577310 [Fimicolochytrium jonesii]